MKQFVKENLIDVLMSEIFDDGKVAIDKFKKGLTKNIFQIYVGPEDFAKMIKPCNIHALPLE